MMAQHPMKGATELIMFTDFVPLASHPDGLAQAASWPELPAPGAAGGIGADAPVADDAFARLASLVRSNDRLMDELRKLDGRLAEARAYLEKTGANPTLGRAQLDRVRGDRSRVLSALRSNRIAAREFLSPPSL